jgi:hypothetical protein
LTINELISGKALAFISNIPVCMKTLYPTQNSRQFTQKALALFIACALIISAATAQTAAAWNFNNTLSTTTVGANLSGPNISLGSLVTTNAFNGGTEFFGQDGWPSGVMDLNAYLQFSVNAGSGYFMVLNSVALVMRHSTLGTAAGSGPASWTLRSSLDGYTANLATGVLTTSYQTFTIALPAAYQSIPSTVTFRVYGYNQTTTSGGLNRFVFDNIGVTGQAMPGILAAQSIDLTAKTIGTVSASGAVSVGLQCQATGFAAGTDLVIERSVNGSDFIAIDRQTASVADAYDYQYADGSAPAVAHLYYRVTANEPGGAAFRSRVVEISPQGAAAAVKGSAIRGIMAQGASIKALLHTEGADSYLVTIWSADGKALYRQAINSPAGEVTTEFSFGAFPHGVYVLTLSNGTTNSSRQFVY